MDSNLLENLIALRDNALQELTEAHDWANQLRAIINEPFGTDRSVEADYLITKILGSFTETISMLNSGKVTDPVPAKPAGVPMNSASLDLFTFQVHRRDQGTPNMDSSLRENLIEELLEGQGLSKKPRSIINESYRSVETDNILKKNLGSYTEALSMLHSGKVTDPVPANSDGVAEIEQGDKRKTAIPRTRITPNLLDDGHSWSKYGRKVIPGAKLPRNYYRCAFGNDQGCKATKLTQETDDDPSMYETKYRGKHTRKNQLTAPPQIILDSITPAESTNSPHFKFGSSNSPNNELDYQSYSTSTTTHHPPVIISSYRT